MTPKTGTKELANMPWARLQRLAKNGVVVAQKELARRSQEQDVDSRGLPCERCAAETPADDLRLWSNAIYLCRECWDDYKVFK